MFVLDGGPIGEPKSAGACSKSCRSDGVWMLMWLLMRYCFSGIYMEAGWLLWSRYRNLSPLSSLSLSVCEEDKLSCLICICWKSQWVSVCVCVSLFPPVMGHITGLLHISVLSALTVPPLAFCPPVLLRPRLSRSRLERLEQHDITVG